MRHEKDLIEIAKFLDEMNASFDTLCDQQSTIVKAYNRLAEIWLDKVYFTTGQVLSDTATITERAYDAFYETCAVLQKQHALLCEYQEIDEARHYTELTFTKNFQWENSYMNNGRISVDPEDIQAFQKSLDVYLDTLEEETRRIKLAYDAVGNSWNDEQYGRFGDHMYTFTVKVEKQIELLDQLAQLIDRKRQLIEEEENLS